MFANPRRYIAIQALVEFVGNAVFNAAIGWYWTQGFERVPIWGWASVAADLLSTGFGIGFLLSLIFTWRLHRRLRRGMTDLALAYPGAVPRIVHGLPFNPWLRSTTIGLIGVAAGAVLVAILQGWGMQTLARADFIALKTVFAAVVAAGAMLAAGYRGLGDGVSPDRPKGYWPD